MALPNQNQSIKNSKTSVNATPGNFKNSQNTVANQGGLNEVKSNQYNTQSKISEKDFDEDDDALMDYDEDSKTLHAGQGSSIEEDESETDSEQSWSVEDDIGNRKQSPEQIGLNKATPRSRH